MNDREKQRLQELVDAIHLTAWALQERQRAALGRAGWGGPMPALPAAPWGPSPVPRGWSPYRLGETLEAAMYVPFVTTVPSIYPVLPAAQMTVGLSHAGIPAPMASAATINPLQLQPGYPIYGYRPAIPNIAWSYPYGPGLIHAGYGYEPLANPIAVQPLLPIAQQQLQPQMAQHWVPVPQQQPLQPNWTPVGQQV